MTRRVELTRAGRITIWIILAVTALLVYGAAQPDRQGNTKYAEHVIKRERAKRAIERQCRQEGINCND